MTASAIETAEAQLADAIAETFADPLAYALLAFEWGKGELEGHDGPDTWQAEVLQDLRDRVLTLDQAIRIAIASGHGIGKSALLAIIILWAMSTRPHLAGVVTANTAAQLETKTWRELSVWHKRAINAHWFTWTATKFYQNQHPETWAVTAIPWNEQRSEAFAGLHAEHVLVIYDEASAIADIIHEVTEGAMTTPGAMWLMFGNPTRNTGRFREAFGRFKHRWKTRQIDSRTARMANKKQIAAWIEDYGEDSDFARVRIRGMFPRAGSNQFIPSDVVQAAAKREAVSTMYDPLVMGVDVARFGDDQSVIRFRRGRDARSIPPIKLRNLDNVQLGARVAALIAERQPDGVFIDETGIGTGVVDYVRHLGHHVVGVNFGSAADAPVDGERMANKRAEMWARGRAWLKTGGAIDDDRELVADLEGVEYGYDGDNRVQLEKKADMKKRGLSSPDDGDAFVLTFAHPVAKLAGGIGRYAGNHGRVESDFDPFA